MNSDSELTRTVLFAVRGIFSRIDSRKNRVFVFTVLPDVDGITQLEGVVQMNLFFCTTIYMTRFKPGNNRIRSEDHMRQMSTPSSLVQRGRLDNSQCDCFTFR